MIQQTIYIAGKVTGLPYKDVYAKFKAKQLELEHLGYKVINPCEITPADADWNSAMRICISALTKADVIYLLPDWVQSRGARLESDLAHAIGITTIFE